MKWPRLPASIVKVVVQNLDQGQSARPLRFGKLDLIAGYGAPSVASLFCAKKPFAADPQINGLCSII
ncbi:hypothetical protein NXC24_PC01276 (plasmid) [Rhizobium sp. NXC24]|nr:hypothetical protein NXC24_PC01276 [Rhizobium sp. NXC24]